MLNNVSANHVIALLAILIGALNCFWGYRILKVILGVTGFCAGAAAGWAASATWAQGNLGVAVLCALAGGILGALLCLWLYFLGIFLLGAGFGCVLATALVTAAGVHHLQLLVILVAAVVCGAIALALQKLMIIVSTAFGGAYLLLGGVLHFVAGAQNPVPVLFERFQFGSETALGYVPLIVWLVLGLVGVAVQYRSRPEVVEVAEERRAEA